MSSSSKRDRLAAIRRDEMARREQDRIVVHHNGDGTSILYKGKNPHTRYLPRELSVWGQIREAFSMG